MKVPWKRSSLVEIWQWPQLFWLQLVGQWEDVESGSVYRLRVLKMIRVLNAISIPFNIFSLLVSLFRSFAVGEFNLVVACCLQGTTICFIMLIELTRHKGKMKNVMRLLDELMKHAVPKIDSTLEGQIRTKYRRCWRLNVALFSHGVINQTSIVAPLFLWVCLGRKMALTEEWPLRLDNWWQFSITLVFQAYVSSIGTVLLFLYGSIYFSICESILINLSILNNFLRKLGSIDVKRERENWMRACIRRHVTILEVCYQLRDSSKLVILVLSTLTSVCLCVFLQAVRDSVLPLPIMLLLSGTGILFMYMMYFYCWYTTEVVHQCQNVADSAYESQWLEWTVEEKKSIVLISAVAQKPLVFGGIVRINLSTFITMFQASFAYYNFLEAVDKK